MSMAGSHGNKGVSVVQASGNFCAFARAFPIITYSKTVLSLESYDHRKHLIFFLKGRGRHGTSLDCLLKGVVSWADKGLSLKAEACVLSLVSAEALV